MSYDTFGGGSHGSHEWVAVGHEKVIEIIGGGPTGERGLVALGVPWEHHYVIRACQLCEEVWWQEYDPAKAKAA